MNDQHQQPIKPDETHGAEIEKTPQMYEKGGPAPGTKHAGEEGKDFVAHTDHSEEKNTANDRDTSK